MRRYPSSPEGLALPVQEVGYEVMEPVRGRTTNHHLYFNKSWYSGNPIHHVFRNLTEHVQTMRAKDHNMAPESLHDTFRPPVRPPTGLMIEVIDEHLAVNGAINLVRERKTNEHFQIDWETWHNIRRGA